MPVRVLIVDDDRVFGQMLLMAVQEFGLSAVHVTNVDDALAELRKQPFEIALLDKNMPDPNGNDEGGMHVLHYIKEHFPPTEVIMMTGYATIQTAIEAMHAGAFDYLLKPFSIQLLKDKIDRLLSFGTFLNPAQIISSYREFYQRILATIQAKNGLGFGNEKEIVENMQAIEKQIDDFLSHQKEWERIILSQRESLARIAVLAEQINEQPMSEPCCKLVRQILAEAQKRL